MGRLGKSKRRGGGGDPGEMSVVSSGRRSPRPFIVLGELGQLQEASLEAVI